MTRVSRGFTLFALTASALLLAACGTTQPHANRTNVADANRVDTILQRAAREAKASGNTTETLALLEQLQQRNPEDAAIATSFGQALREDAQLNRARQILTPFTGKENAYPDAVTELAMVQLALGQYKEAELTSRRAVELDPQSGRAFLALGTALDAQNYHEQAEVAFRRGLDRWKGDPAPILNNLALNLASQDKLDQALDLLYKAREASPGRMEIERNIRIISTLKEGATDFLKDNGRTGAPKITPRKVEPKADADVKKEDAAAKKPAAEAAEKKKQD